MAINRYFENFPVINYSNTDVIDITKRVAVLEKIYGDPYIFYPYEIVQYERADQFSTRYYEDPYKSWILYLTNKMMDPYHEWYKQQNELEELCVKKYGSLYSSKSKTKYYRNNYLSGETLTISAFNALPQQLKKFWTPTYGFGEKVVGYEKKVADWTTGTNKIVKYELSQSSNTFIKDEIVTITYDPLNYGQGQVLSCQGNTLFVQHVAEQYYETDTVVILANSHIYGSESDSNAVFTDFSWVANNIPEEELGYWTSVSYYDYENEKNEFYKTITVIDSQYAKTVSDNLRDLLKE